MFDILKCDAANLPNGAQHGFSKFYAIGQAKGKVVECENVILAAQHKNRKTLILLKDFAYDDGSIKLIAEKKSACFLIDLSRLINTRGLQRAILLSKIRTFLEFCVRHGAYYTFASFAASEQAIRSPEELQHIAMLFGINRGQAKFALKMLSNYLG